MVDIILIYRRDDTATISVPYRINRFPCKRIKRSSPLDEAGRIVYRGDPERTLLSRTINYGVQARTEAFQKLFNCLRGIAEQKYKGMIYIRSCFLCIECSRCRARAVEEMERARRKRVCLFSFPRSRFPISVISNI